MLNELRLGRVSTRSVEALQARVGRTVARAGVEPTELLPRVAGVEAKNATKLAALPAPHMRYVLEAFFTARSSLDGTWVRALGDKATPCTLEGGGVPLPDNAELAADHPLKAVHLHGLGSRRHDDAVQAAVRVALARTSLVPLLTLAVGAQIVFTVNVDPPLIVNGTRGCVEEFDMVDGLPIVRLLCGTLRKVLPTVHTHKLPHGMRALPHGAKDGDKSKLVHAVGVAQLPLQLAFALTVHRAQGMTLELGYANLGTDVFGDGLAYVALSRFPGFDSFALTDFSPVAVRANRDIVAWYEAAYVVADACASEE
jgi:hypothetical protein